MPCTKAKTLLRRAGLSLVRRGSGVCRALLLPARMPANYYGTVVRSDHRFFWARFVEKVTIQGASSSSDARVFEGSFDDMR